MVRSVSGNSVKVDDTIADAVTNWDGGDPFTHGRILQKMREVLDSEEMYPYLDDASSEALRAARATSRMVGFTDSMSPGIGEDAIDIHPWIGSIQFDTLVRILKGIDGISVSDCIPPYSVRIRTGYSMGEVADLIESHRSTVDPFDLITKNDYLEYEKFDRFVPRQLLRKKFVRDRIDLNFSI